MAYLGEFPIDINETPFKDYTPVDWALYYIECYSGIDGSHHKSWVMDQIARILKNTPVIVTQAQWDNNDPEYRIRTGEPSLEYQEWVVDMKGEYDEENEEYEYSYETGISP